MYTTSRKFSCCSLHCSGRAATVCVAQLYPSIRANDKTCSTRTHTHTPTHDSQWAKNKLSLFTVLQLNQADVTVSAMKVEAILTGATYCSPG